jgi:hypothetical protein
VLTVGGLGWVKGCVCCREASSYGARELLVHAGIEA